MPDAASVPVPSLRERLEAHAKACRDALDDHRLRPMLPQDIADELRRLIQNGDGADLDGAYLAGAYLAGAYLAGAYLVGAYLVGASLAGANLVGANLVGAYLDRADLDGANLGGARGVAPAATAAEPAAEPKPPQTYEQWLAQRPKNAHERMQRYRQDHPDVPVVENLDSKILAAVTSGGGTLDMSQWHTCETTHCRAGWAIHLAGDAGRALEAKLGPHGAGAAIYRASTGRVPHFFATTASAIADIRECAAREAEDVASPAGGAS